MRLSELSRNRRRGCQGRRCQDIALTLIPKMQERHEHEGKCRKCRRQDTACVMTGGVSVTLRTTRGVIGDSRENNHRHLKPCLRSLDGQKRSLRATFEGHWIGLDSGSKRLGGDFGIVGMGGREVA